MKLEDINIRDPFILTYDNKYYLYGTRSYSTWGKADGFDAYVSTDMDNWDGPFEVFRKTDDFEPDQNYWAPEVVYYKENFYFVTTFGSESKKKGIWVLKSDKPLGPFEVYSDGAITPSDWTCIDGTVYFEDEKPYLVFSHSFEDDPDGTICYMEMSEDLSKTVSDPIVMTKAVDAPWAIPVPFAKEEFGMDGDVYFTDGPSLNKFEDGILSMTWSSWSRYGYAVGIAASDNGKINGKWKHVSEPLFDKDGGHGMMFKNLENELMFTLHYPNDFGKEHPEFYLVERAGDKIINAVK